MSDAVTLISKSRRSHTILLDHDVFRTREHGFKVQRVKLAGGEVRRATIGSLTLLPGQRIEGLHPAIEHLPQVVKLMQQREVAVEHQVSTRVDTQDPPQTERGNATLGRSRVRVEKGT